MKNDIRIIKTNRTPSLPTVPDAVFLVSDSNENFSIYVSDKNGKEIKKNEEKDNTDYLAYYILAKG